MTGTLDHPGELVRIFLSVIFPLATAQLESQNVYQELIQPSTRYAVAVLDHYPRKKIC